MTVSIEKANEAFEYYKHQISKVNDSGHLTQEGKAAELKTIAGELDAQLAYWKDEVAKEKQQTEAELEKLKPNTVNRDLNAQTVAALNYQAKVFLSRLSAEGETVEGYKAALLDIVDNGNDISRQAFLDSYHDIKSLSESFNHNGAVYLKDYYIRAKNIMKTPEQKAYETSLNEAIKKSNSLTTKLIAVERSVQNIKNSTSTVAASTW